MKRFYPALLLLIVAILTYGLLISQLGFYWDDLPISWIRYQLGPAALSRYFSTNRPVWGLLYQITTRVIPQVPIDWQIFALFWRWLGAVVVYEIVVKLWQDKPRLALGVAMLFLVYPGFLQNWSAFLYSHFYIVLCFFLFSLFCMLQAIASPKRDWVWTGVGMVFSALNLWMMEYFYVLELVRVGVILTALRDESRVLRDRLLRGLKWWIPYLAVFLFSVFSRLFIFNNQVYGMGLTGKLKTAPVEATKELLQSILLSLRLVLKDAWLQVVDFTDIALGDPIIRSYYVVIAIVILIAAAGFLLIKHDATKPVRKNSLDMAWMIGLGALAVFLSGWPFWLIGFVPSLQWPANRFTLPFAFGVALIYGGIIGLIPWDKLRIVLLVSLVSLATGRQFLTSHEYAQDWGTQKELFWQMTWRAPSIQSDTLILMNEDALKYYADNSLSAALNWIYAPDNHSSHIEYVLFYPKTRLRNELPKFAPGLSIYYNYLAGEFNGNTSQALAIYYDPPGCLRILDPEVEHLNRLIPESSLMRYAANISNPQLVLATPRAQMPVVYGPEPVHDFCYYFEKADLARQFGDWSTVVNMSDRALSFTDHPYNPAEQMVFIESYAHAGKWDRAIELSQRAYTVSEEVVGPMLCQLWERIRAETGGGEARSAALSQSVALFGCNP